MATTFEELIVGSYQYAGNPSHSRVPLPVVAQKVQDAINWCLALLNLTDQNWIVNQTPLTIDPSSIEYTISASNFGRPILVEITGGDGVSTDLSLVRTQVPFFDLQDAALRDVPYNPNSNHLGLVFYREDGQVKVRTVPGLGEGSKELNIIYEPLAFTPTTITANPGIIEPMYGLVKTKVAISILGLAGHSTETFGQLMQTLAMDKADYESAFRQYIQIDANETAGEIRPFNSSRMGEDGY
jgi:hypothetical protein